MVRTARRHLALFATALLMALVAVACRAGDQEPTPAPLVMAPGEVLLASAESFSQEVQSFRGTFKAAMAFEDFELDMEGDFAFRAPDTMHMTMVVYDATVELLMVVPDFYLRPPNDDWYVLRAEASGVDRDAFQRYLENRGVVDYSAMTEQLEELTQLPDVSRGGVVYLHYRGTIDFADLIDDLSEDLIAPSLVEQAQEVFEPADVELWLERQTFLPRQVDLRMTFSSEGSSFGMDMSMRFADYNQPVSIREPPADAKPFESLYEDVAPLRPGHTLGLRCSYASRFLTERYDLRPGKGCVVLRVGSPGAAERAGFRVGDKIVQMDGVPITSGRQFTRRFEELPGSGHHEFVVQRGDEDLTLELDLADGSGLPNGDPYFYYLRAKGDTGLKDYDRVIADYTRAIELEPAFELPYLYRGMTYSRQYDERAEADLLRALELDPDLTEAHRALARIRFRQGDFSGAFERIDRSLALNGCGVYVEPWDLDCGEDLMFRSALYFDRLELGDELVVESHVDMVADVVFLEPTVAATRFELAYMRGDDAAAMELAQELLLTPLYSFNDQAVLRHRVRQMLEAHTLVLHYHVRDWFYYTALTPNIWAPDAPMQEAGVSGMSLYFEFTIPGLTGGETISWEVRRGPYRLAGSEDINTTGDRFVINVGGSRQLPAGHYELDVYVDGERALTIPLDVP